MQGSSSGPRVTTKVSFDSGAMLLRIFAGIATRPFSSTEYVSRPLKKDMAETDLTIGDAPHDSPRPPFPRLSSPLFPTDFEKISQPHSVLDPGSKFFGVFNGGISLSRISHDNGRLGGILIAVIRCLPYTF